MDTSKNIKALTSLVGKPLNVWNASDVDKIVESNERDLLLDTDTVEYIISNSNEEISSICTPIYVQLSFNETMDYVEGLLKRYFESMEKLEDGTVKENPEIKEELKVQMLSFLESPALIEYLSAVVVLFNLFPDYDLTPEKENIKASLRQLEDITCLIPLEGGMTIFQKILDTLYFPLITAWYERNNELLLEKKNEKFSEKLNEYSAYIKANEEAFMKQVQAEVEKREKRNA